MWRPVGGLEPERIGVNRTPGRHKFSLAGAGTVQPRSTMARPRISIVAITGLLGGIVGCAGQRAETEKQLRGMEDRIAILQNERDRLDERVTALESQQKTRVDAPRPAPTSRRPLLEVVRLSPDDEVSSEAGGEAEVTGPAPVADESERTLLSGSGTKLQASPVSQVTGAKAEERE